MVSGFKFNSGWNNVKVVIPVDSPQYGGATEIRYSRRLLIAHRLKDIGAVDRDRTFTVFNLILQDSLPQESAK